MAANLMHLYLAIGLFAVTATVGSAAMFAAIIAEPLPGTQDRRWMTAVFAAVITVCVIVMIVRSVEP